MNNILETLFRIREESTCLKRKTACLVIKDGQIIAKSTNHCNPPNGICQRMNTQTGQNYGLCDSKHAEEGCALQMREKGLSGGEAYLLGHYYACDNCQELLREREVSIIHLMRDDNE